MKTLIATISIITLMVMAVPANANTTDSLGKIPDDYDPEKSLMNFKEILEDKYLENDVTIQWQSGETLDVVTYGQQDPEWGDEYLFGISSNPTLYQAGCLVTSGASTFRYLENNSSIDPSYVNGVHDDNHNGNWYWYVDDKWDYDGFDIELEEDELWLGTGTYSILAQITTGYIDEDRPIILGYEHPGDDHYVVVDGWRSMEPQNLEATKEAENEVEKVLKDDDVDVEDIRNLIEDGTLDTLSSNYQLRIMDPGGETGTRKWVDESYFDDNGYDIHTIAVYQTK